MQTVDVRQNVSGQGDTTPVPADCGLVSPDYLHFVPETDWIRYF